MIPIRNRKAAIISLLLNLSWVAFIIWFIPTMSNVSYAEAWLSLMGMILAVTIMIAFLILYGFIAIIIDAIIDSSKLKDYPY